MKKKIAILGSTGSIGKTTIKIIKKNKKNFDVILLTTNKNVNEIIKQARILKVRNILISSRKHYLQAKNKKIKNIKIHNNLDKLNKIIKKKLDYCMCAITGLAGLKPTLSCIKHTKKIAIANKESIICAWNLIEKELKKNKTDFVPVDSEHFSIWSLLKNSNNEKIHKVIITASGGPFLNLSGSKFKNITPKRATRHPRWSMGKKISIDSSNLMNKVFEIIEAKKIFNLKFSQLNILVHPKSYVHAIIIFKNGLTKILVHDTDMSIPIFNSIYGNEGIYYKVNSLNVNKINNLNFSNVDNKKFPAVNFLKKIPDRDSLFETVLISANEVLVDSFLNNMIKYTDINKKLKKILNISEFKRLKKVYPKSLKQIIDIDKKVRQKTYSLIVS